MNKYIQELQRMSDSDITFDIVAVWRNSFKIGFGNVVDGIKEKTFENLQWGVEWLINEVMKQYSGSVYARVRIRMINKLREGLVDIDKFTNELLNEMLWSLEKQKPWLYGEIKRDIEKGDE